MFQVPLKNSVFSVDLADIRKRCENNLAEFAMILQIALITCCFHVIKGKNIHANLECPPLEYTCFFAVYKNIEVQNP